MGRPIQSHEMPLQPQVLVEPFEKWALNFVGPINPSSKPKRYILIYVDYVTKWVEANPLNFTIENVVFTFIFEDIFTRFSVLREIIRYQGMKFTSKLMQKIMKQYKIKHRKSM